jgi:SSS family solute:Na+ symporter
MILNVLFRPYFPGILQSPINAGAFCMLAGLVIVPLVSMITKAPEKSVIDNSFACYDETVSVKMKDDLGNT